MDSPVKIRKIILAPGKHEITIAPESFASIYVLDGPIRISKHQADRDDFILVENPGTVQLENMDSGIIYLLENPLNPGYPTYSKILKPN